MCRDRDAVFFNRQTLSRSVSQLMLWVFSRAGAASRYISAHCLLLVLPVLARKLQRCDTVDKRHSAPRTRSCPYLYVLPAHKRSWSLGVQQSRGVCTPSPSEIRGIRGPSCGKFVGILNKESSFYS